MASLRALMLLTVATGCLRAPDRPSDGIDAMPGPCASAATSAELRTSAVVLDADGSTVELVRAGAWNGHESIVIHRAGPTFDLACPDQVIALQLADAPIRAITPMQPGTFAVLVEKAPGQWRVHRIALGTPTVQDLVSTYYQPESVGAGWIAYHPLDQQLVFGGGRSIWLVDTAAAFTQTLETPIDPDIGDTLYAAGPLRSTATTDPRWAFLGAQAAHFGKITVNGTTSIAYVHTAHTDDTDACKTDYAMCPRRIARGVIPRSNKPATVTVASETQAGHFERALDGGTVNDLDLSLPPGLDVLEATVQSATEATPMTLLGSVANPTALLTLKVDETPPWNLTLPSAGPRPRLEIGEFTPGGGPQALLLAENPFASDVTQSCIQLTGAMQGLVCAR